MPPATRLDLVAENAELRAKLAETEDMLRAIRQREIDAQVTHSDTGPRAYKRVEDELRRNEQLHRIVFDLAPVGLVYTALDARFVNVNTRMCEITGYTAEELLRMTGADLTHPDDLAHDNELVDAFLSGGTPVYANEKRYVRKDGSSRWVSVTARMVTDDAGRPLHGIGTIRDIHERKTAEASLRTSEIRYRRLFEAAHDGVLILDPATRKIVDSNPFMTTLLGYPHDQLIGMELYQIGFLADAQASRDMFQTLTDTCQVRYENLPLQNRAGGLREVEVVANLYDEDGRSVVQCNVRDITERRKAETELRERHHLLNRIFEVLPGVLYVFDLDENRAVFVNNTAKLTYSPEEIAAMGVDMVRNLMHPDDQPRFQEHLADIRTLSAGATATFEYRMRDKAGEWRWYMGTDTVFLRDESGAARQLIGIAPEITDRKRAEFALQSSEHRYRTLIEATSAVTWSCAPSGLLVESQPQWTAFTGQSTSEVLGGGHATAFHPDDAENAWARWADAVALDAPYHNELRIRRHDGEWRWMRVECVPVHRGGVVVEWFGMCIDITERKEQEEHLRFLMKEVNHRSKNLLGLVLAVAQQTAKTSPDDFVVHFRERIQALAGAQDLLVKNEWRAVSLSELIRSQLAHFQDLIGDRIQLHGPVVEVLPAAAQSIGMAVHELATNAGKYGALSNGIGRVEVTWNMRAGQCGEPQFLMSWTETDGPPVTRPTRRGFGSSVIGGIINMSLDCDAEIDYAPTGFRWRIACPADKLVGKAEAEKARPAPPVDQSAGNGSKRVLVVEDEALIAMDIAAILSDAGFTVVGPVGSVAHALALIERSGCEAAVLDINLGKETAEPIACVLRARATPFVTISGYSREQQPAAFRNAPLVSKPVRPELLVAEIRKCFAEAF